MVTLLMLNIQKASVTMYLKQPLVNVGGNKCWDKVKSVLIVHLPFQKFCLLSKYWVNLLIVSILGYSEVILSDS